MKQIGIVLVFVLTASVRGDVVRGGGLTRAIADTLYCRLSGCTMSGSLGLANGVVLSSPANEAFQVTDGAKAIRMDLSGLSAVRTVVWQDIAGGTIYVSGGTDVPVADGGTGVSSLTPFAPIFGGTTATGPVQSGTVGSANQVLVSNGAGALATFQTATLAGAQFANQGTITTVLHGNASGNPSFGKVVDGDVTYTAPFLGAPTATTIQTSGNLGLGVAPSGTAGTFLLASGALDAATQATFANTNNSGTSARASVVMNADTAIMNVTAHGTGRTTSRFGVAIGGYSELLSSAGNGLLIGTSGAVPVKIGTNATTIINLDNLNNMQLPILAVTAGTMTGTYEAVVSGVRTCRTWTNAQVAALSGTAGDIAWGTLPAKTEVRDVKVIITGAAVGPTTVTVSVGRTSASYIDYTVASDAKAAANTVYGDTSGERGTNLTGYDLPSYTGTTLINAHFISTVANLSTTTGSTGVVCITTDKLP